MGHLILVGDSKETLKTLPDNSIDAIVTDPPYDLTSIQKRFGGANAAPAKFGTDGVFARSSRGFMGKTWDGTGVAFQVEFWEQVFRVLKPGGHVAAFGGSRTYHRMAVAIEDAGLEIRDSLFWVYGSGFPKSHDIGKGIDKQDAVQERRERSLRFTAWMRSTGITAQAINEATGTQMGYHYTTHPTQPEVATADQFDLLRPILPAVPEEIEELVRIRTVESQAFKSREVLERSTNGAGNTGTETVKFMPPGSKEFNITAPATPEAEAWDGWGTALKPAQEPIVLARKPISEGSIAANVLRWGTGAINIGASRVGTDKVKSSGEVSNAWRTMEGRPDRQTPRPTVNTGRWPANILLTCCGMVPHRPGCPVLELDRQSGTGKGSKPGYRQSGNRNATGGVPGGYGFGGDGTKPGYGDSGGASRYFANLDFDADLDDLIPFFYTAKASRAERDLGLDDLERKEANELVDRKEGSAGLNSPRAGAGRTSGGRNTHPTVKPLKLMEWLITLITPPGGVVCDPFMGSGSTGMAAILNGFDFIGGELTEEYVPIALGRLNWAAEQKAKIDAAPKQATIFDELEGGDDGGEPGDEGEDSGRVPGPEREADFPGGHNVYAQGSLERASMLSVEEDDGVPDDLPDGRLVEG